MHRPMLRLEVKSNGIWPRQSWVWTSWPGPGVVCPCRRDRLLRQVSGGVFAHVPDQCCNGVSPGPQMSCDVEGFAAPVEQVSSRRAARHLDAVDVESVAIVRQDTDRKGCGSGGKVHFLAEMVDTRFSRRSLWIADPACSPGASRGLIARLCRNQTRCCKQKRQRY